MPRVHRKPMRPPLAPAVVLIGLAMVGALSLVQVSRDASAVHLTAALVGIFGSVIVFGWFRLVVNSRSSSGNFSDWGFISSSQAIRILLLASWVLGVANLFLFVYEWARTIA